jgi:geranylgeranyl pyrophosphate synthase
MQANEAVYSPDRANGVLQGRDKDVISRLGFAREISALRTHVEEWVAAASEEMTQELRWQLLASSKYFRPLTVFSCHQAATGSSIGDDVIDAALSIEVLHNVSLVIDDIVDKSDERRGRPTLHRRFGELSAIMTAGYMVADMFGRSRSDPYSISLFAELLKRLGVAECRQWRLRRQPLGVEDWRAIAGEDTGSMFDICAGLGDRSQRLRRFGYLLGMLYHGCDDVADVRGLTALGGGGGDDLRDGILTLPAAIAIRDREIAERFARGAESDLSLLAEAFLGALPEAEQHLDRLATEAKTEARTFARQPEVLIELVDVTRELAWR